MFLYLTANIECVNLKIRDFGDSEWLYRKETLSQALICATTLQNI